ncbi:MAG: OmpA family protein, partial [Pseudomonadota bacterium]|nr:OmpA family protein [Pseudomonadota bacterium]
SSHLQDYTREILSEIGRTLNDVPNHISIAGHTDARAYAGGEKGFSNWDLSAERANAARRAMVEAGLQQDRVIRIVGLGSTVLFNPDDPMDPMNRRISIVVMNRRTETAVRKDTIAQGGGTDEARDAGSGRRPEILDGVKPDLRPGIARPREIEPPRLELTPTSPRGY